MFCSDITHISNVDINREKYCDALKNIFSQNACAACRDGVESISVSWGGSRPNDSGSEACWLGNLGQSSCHLLSLASMVKGAADNSAMTP
jgi:hypothetical protein